MTPNHFTQNGTRITYHYSFADLRRWIKYAYEGCAGALLVGREGHRMVYKCSGTFEHPRPIELVRELITLQMMHNDIFDGPLPKDEEICTLPNPDKYPFSRVIWLDMGDATEEPNIQKILPGS